MEDTTTTQTIKIKIGDAVFEAEGPTNIVGKQYQSFIDLLSKTPATPWQTGTPDPAGEEGSGVRRS